MNIELDAKLCKKYPKIFVNRHGLPTETLMCFGFEHGDGWYDILDSLCGQIQNHIDWQNKNHEKHPVVNQVVAVQVKEKFGGLRFYYEGGDDTVSGMVRMAESWAEHTCEVCGNKGVTRGGGWLRTLCDEHSDGREPVNV